MKKYCVALATVVLLGAFQNCGKSSHASNSFSKSTEKKNLILDEVTYKMTQFSESTGTEQLTVKVQFNNQGKITFQFDDGICFGSTNLSNAQASQLAALINNLKYKVKSTRDSLSSAGESGTAYIDIKHRNEPEVERFFVSGANLGDRVIIAGLEPLLKFLESDPYELNFEDTIQACQ